MPSTLGCISMLALTLLLFPHAAQGTANLPSFNGVSVIEIRSSSGNTMWYLVRGFINNKKKILRSESRSESTSHETAMGH
jgi:hypothetical protein